MEKETYLVVVSIHEGRNFLSKPRHDLIIECKFDGELLSTDPVACTHNPDFTTELAWEMERKALHQHRMQRTPVKLQCYVVDQLSKSKQSAGYILLDLRGVQTKEKPARWYSLLGKTSRSKPEVRISMILEDDSVQDINSNFKAQEAPPRTIVPMSNGEPMIAVLNAEKGHFQVGVDSPDCEIFILSIIVGSASNLDKLVSGNKLLPTTSSGFFFYYTLFGSDITNDPFNDLINPTYTPERATVRVRSTVSMLKIYFSQNSELNVHLCCGDSLLGTAVVPFTNLFNQVKLDALANEPIVIKDNFPLNKDSVTENNSILPSVNVTVSLGRDDVDVNPVLTSSPKKNVKINEKNEVNNLLNPEKNIVACASETEDDVESIIASDLKTNSKPNSLTTTDTHTNDANLVHHFKFSINIKSVSKLDLPRVCNLFVKYSYPFFGSSAPVMTKPVEVKRNSETILPKSLCIFNFACTSLSLSNTFLTVPLHLEVWHKDKETKDVLLGTADLSLSQIVKSAKEKTITKLNGNDVNTIKQSCNGQLPVVSRTNKNIALINVSVSLDDFGPSKEYSVPDPVKPPHKSPIKQVATSSPQKAVVEDKPIRETDEYKAAVQLELWKSEQQEIFQQRMRECEVEHLKLLSEEFKKRDREREMLVAKRVSEYQELEKQLSDTITSLEKREQAVSKKEAEMKRLQQDFEREVKSHNGELEHKTKQLKSECDSKVKLELDRRKLLEEHNKKLSSQVSDLERKYESLMNNFHEYKNQTTRPEIRLEAELNLAKLEKSELERKLESVNKSKLHYKQQWGRTLRELALMKKREQEHARANLRYQQQELEMLKQQVTQPSPESISLAKAEQERIEKMENEIRALRENVNSNNLKSNNMQTESIVIPQASSINACGDAPEVMMNERVARLVEERNTLLKTGVYSKSDRIISELDRQINECMRSGSNII